MGPFQETCGFIVLEQMMTKYTSQSPLLELREVFKGASSPFLVCGKRYKLVKLVKCYHSACHCLLVHLEGQHHWAGFT